MTTESGADSARADDLDLFESEATGKPDTTATSTTIPAKYVGKTVEDLIKMHQNAERKISLQGEEVSQVRRIADEILQLKKPTTQTTVEHKPVTVDALLNDPEKAIRSAVENSDLGRRAVAAEARVERLETQITEAEFLGKHKNVASDINDPLFLDWVNKNGARQALAAAAAVKNFKAAKDLWDMWEEHKELASAGQQRTDASGAKPKTVPSTVRQAPIDSVKGKPIWSHAKLMDLRLKVQQGNPAALTRWNDPAFQERMHEAYAEKRIK